MPAQKLNSKAHLPQAFTLVELLIVIAIIGILAGVILAVLNPAQQRRRASEGTMRANTAKACQALTACMSSLTKPNTAYCDSFAKIGVNDPTGVPAGANYFISSDPGEGPWDYVFVYSNLSGTNCYMICLVFNDFQNWNGQPPGYLHTRGWQNSDCIIGE